MDKFAPNSSDVSHSDNVANARFTSQAATAEDLLKAQTVGLVNLNDYRKRRAEALDLKERGGTPQVHSGTSTPQEEASTPKPLFKKKRKVAGKGKLSFGIDEDDEANSSVTKAPVPAPRDITPADADAVPSDVGSRPAKKKLGANTSVGLKPRVMTKTALQREAQQADLARHDFVVMRAAVKATEVVMPFVFYDGTNTPGGRCRIKKGEQIWLFLDKARKVGAELGVGGGDRSQREWARVSVDDLMLVRDEVILPHHYEIYHFLFNKVPGFNGLLFDYSAQPTKATPVATGVEDDEPAAYDPLNQSRKDKNKESSVPDNELEGFSDDPAVTKVVDRRWYERNKHIFPASAWAEYAPDKDLSTVKRKDTEGNTFFFT